MAFQRKVFRIEECARVNAPSPALDHQADGALRHREFMAEMQALRTLIAPPSTADRSAMDRARAQIVEAQAYRHELDLICEAVSTSKAKAGTGGAGDLNGGQIARIGRELQAIVAGTEQAAHSILQAAEEIEQAVNGLSAVLEGEHDKQLARDILDRVVQIFAACGFQDIAGQRVSNAFAALGAIEERILRLQSIWSSVERFEPIVLGETPADDRGLLNGPTLPGDPGQSGQDDIDAVFGGD